jgi:hypothetical protein
LLAIAACNASPGTETDGGTRTDNPPPCRPGADADGDGIPDQVDVCGRDSDRDGVQDYLDLDSDNDKLPDAWEDPDGDGRGPPWRPTSRTS